MKYYPNKQFNILLHLILKQIYNNFFGLKSSQEKAFNLNSIYYWRRLSIDLNN